MTRADKIARILIGALAAFFGALVLPRVFPIVDTTTAFFLYFLAVVLLAGLLGVILLTSAVVAFFTRGGENPRVFDRAVRALRVSTAGLGFFCVARLILLLAPQALPSSSYIDHFDHVRWTSPDAAEYRKGDITPRQRMLGDVVDRILPGATQQQIEAQLGPSLDTSYFLGGGRDMIYILGPERGFMGIDSEWLLIWLDSGNRFRKYEFARD